MTAPMSLDEAITQAVTAAVDRALARHLRHRAPDPVAVPVPVAAQMLSTSEWLIRQLIDRGVLPIVPHIHGRTLVPVRAIEQLAAGEVSR